jgi:hypothetical protein
MVRGADGDQYGPATLDQLSTWIREGRLQAQAGVKRSDMEHWATARDFSELQPAFAGTSSPPAAVSTSAGMAAQAPAAQTGPATVAQLRSGASWFYWIAGLSLINAIAAFSGSSWRFIIGLGVTQIFDALGVHIGGSGKVVALALDLLAAGMFVLFGIFANKGQAWAFIVGMVLFALDGLIFLLGPDWLGVAFHVLVLYWLFRGFSASRNLVK